MEEVLEGRTEVTYEDLEKLQYTEQVRKGNVPVLVAPKLIVTQLHGMLTAAVIKFVCKLAIGS